MNDIDPITGLPRDISAFENLSREGQEITLMLVKRRYGKQMTVIAGFDMKSVDLQQVMKKLKNKLACGGTVKDTVIELQGNHIDRVKKELVSMGFNEDSIRVVKKEQ